MYILSISKIDTDNALVTSPRIKVNVIFILWDSILRAIRSLQQSLWFVTMDPVYWNKKLHIISISY